MGTIKLRICKNENEISDSASNMMDGLVNNRKKSNLGLATGSSPIGTYKKIIEKYNNCEVCLKHVRTFNLDVS